MSQERKYHFYGVMRNKRKAAAAAAAAHSLGCAAANSFVLATLAMNIIINNLNWMQRLLYDFYKA